ncbi:hypothetical protein DCAR_0729022 [Daucus carota subsp. sativus]|uniref:DUF3511 domain-containing protein n=1 Tax=Daucus carota subsp. sativus TaxID=79200 RepID=A0A164TZ68_DAUCS|nr:hypothetical protein DCAR_0729022 [Daucus carota subsp. sativus]
MENFSRLETTSRKNVAKNDNKGTDHVNSNYLPLPLPPQRLSLPSGNKMMEVKRPGMRRRSKASSRSTSWFASRDMGRKKRITMYKVYDAEGKMKRSFKKGLQWIKHQCKKIADEFS